MKPIHLDALRFDPAAHLSWFQELLALGRETIPQRTSAAAREGLKEAAAALGLEYIEKTAPAPSFLLISPGAAEPDLVVFGVWHAEGQPVHPAAAEGSERLALVSALGALQAIRVARPESRPALVVAPASTHGSFVLDEILRGHRAALQAPVGFWPRITASAPDRRRVFLGARGRVVLAVRGEDANPHAIRDRLIADLSAEAYGPRPLDFELLRKLGDSAAALDFLEEAFGDPAVLSGAGTDRLQRALFLPVGRVARPPVRHPDRPSAWISIDTAESMEPSDVASRARALAGSAVIDLVEGFPWDRQNIHHPAVQAEIQSSKRVSQGAEIWPVSPWPTPSGVFTRALGTPLAEWAVPLPSGASIRGPTSDLVETLERELAELFLRGTGVLPRSGATT